MMTITPPPAPTTQPTPPPLRWYHYASDGLLWGILLFWWGTAVGLSDSSLREQVWHWVRGYSDTISIRSYNAGSLTAGTPVYFMGVRVGEVRQVYFTRDSATASNQPPTVTIRYTLTSMLSQLPKNAQASVASNGLGGGKSLEFELPEANADLNAPNATTTEDKSLLTATRQQALLQEQMLGLKLLKQTSDKLTLQLAGLPMPSLKQQLHQAREQSSAAWPQQLAQLQADQYRQQRQLQQQVQQAQQFLTLVEGTLNETNSTVQQLHKGLRTARFTSERPNQLSQLSLLEGEKLLRLEKDLKELRQQLSQIEHSPPPRLNSRFSIHYQKRL
ncbi:MAG: MlaD family protein [Vampirovibrionales bacterium]